MATLGLEAGRIGCRALTGPGGVWALGGLEVARKGWGPCDRAFLWLLPNDTWSVCDCLWDDVWQVRSLPWNLACVLVGTGGCWSQAPSSWDINSRGPELMAT